MGDRSLADKDEGMPPSKALAIPTHVMRLKGDGDEIPKDSDYNKKLSRQKSGVITVRNKQYKTAKKPRMSNYSFFDNIGGSAANLANKIGASILNNRKISLFPTPSAIEAESQADTEVVSGQEEDKEKENNDRDASANDIKRRTANPSRLSLQSEKTIDSKGDVIIPKVKSPFTIRGNTIKLNGGSLGMPLNKNKSSLLVSKSATLKNMNILRPKSIMVDVEDAIAAPKVVRTRVSEHRSVNRIFSGTWESDVVALDTFMSELNLGKNFAKLAMNFGGDVKQVLQIKQTGEKGERFEITEINDRREIVYVINIGEEFTSVNELDDELKCFCSWGVATEADIAKDNDQETGFVDKQGNVRNVLVIDQLNTVTKEHCVITRRICEDSSLLETRKEDDGKETSRTYFLVP